MRISIGIDVDAVLADTVSGILRHLNEKFGLGLSLDDVTEYYVDKWLGDRPDLADLRTRLLYEHDFYGRLTPLADAVTSVHALAAQGPCHFITARPEEFCAVTSEWLVREGFPADIPVRCTWEKSAAAQELGLNYFVEDSHEQAQRLANAGLTVFLFDYPWNRHVPGEPPLYASDGGTTLATGRIIRVRGWREVLGHLGLSR